jgi:hypothetical protein
MVSPYFAIMAQPIFYSIRIRLPFLSKHVYLEVAHPTNLKGEGKGTGLFKFIASITYIRFSRSSTLPRYYPFGLSKSRNNPSLINLQHRGKPASGQNPYVISPSWLFRRINPPTSGLEPSTFPRCMSQTHYAGQEMIPLYHLANGRGSEKERK